MLIYMALLVDAVTSPSIYFDIHGRPSRNRIIGHLLATTMMAAHSLVSGYVLALYNLLQWVIAYGSSPSLYCRDTGSIPGIQNGTDRLRFG